MPDYPINDQNFEAWFQPPVTENPLAQSDPYREAQGMAFIAATQVKRLFEDTPFRRDVLLQLRQLYDRILAALDEPPAHQTLGPYAASPQSIVGAMLTLAGVRRGDHVVDIGCGDGRLVNAAARLGARATGLDTVPELVARAERDKVPGAQFYCADALAVNLLRAIDPSVVTCFLTTNGMRKLLPVLSQLRPGTRVVSHFFEIPGWVPVSHITVEAEPDQYVSARARDLYLWVVP